MTSAKKLVLAAHPTARIERHKRNLGKSYYLVRIHDAGPRGFSPRQMWSGSGDTPGKAWADAADRLHLRLPAIEGK